MDLADLPPGAVALGSAAAFVGACLALVVARLTAARPAKDRAERLDRIAADIARDGAELRLAVESRLASLAALNAQEFLGLRDSLSDQIGAQIASVQRAVGEVQSSASQIADLRRLFSSVRARGAWGEGQLRALLDDILPAGGYEADCRVRDNSAERVEFAIRMPSPGPAGARPLLAIDSKFPTEAYDRLIAAEEAGDAAAARAARRGLEAALRLEARRIASKYIAPPATVDFAILYLPTDGLYVEASRLPGVFDEIGRAHRVLVMGPAILPGLLRSIQLGAMTLALGERAEQIGRLLGATRHEMRLLDETLEKLARQAAGTSAAIEEARRRTRTINRDLTAAAASGGAETAAPAEVPLNTFS